MLEQIGIKDPNIIENSPFLNVLIQAILSEDGSLAGMENLSDQQRLATLLQSL